MVTLAPPIYSPGQPRIITVPPVLSTTLERAKAALQDMAVLRLCP